MDLDRSWPALERWWAELPRSRRRQARQMDPAGAVPEDLVVTLLLHGLLAPAQLGALGDVRPPRGLSEFIAGRPDRGSRAPRPWQAGAVSAR